MYILNYVYVDWSFSYKLYQFFLYVPCNNSAASIILSAGKYALSANHLEVNPNWSTTFRERFLCTQPIVRSLSYFFFNCTALTFRIANIAVLLRNLDTLTTEDSVLGILQTIPGVATLPIKSVRIGRDPLNNISRGICYLDMNNNSDAMRLFSGLSSLQGLYIDGREGKHLM